MPKSINAQKKFKTPAQKSFRLNFIFLPIFDILINCIRRTLNHARTGRMSVEFNFSQHKVLLLYAENGEMSSCRALSCCRAHSCASLYSKYWPLPSESDYVVNCCDDLFVSHFTFTFNKSASRPYIFVPAACICRVVIHLHHVSHPIRHIDKQNLIYVRVNIKQGDETRDKFFTLILTFCLINNY